MRERIAIAFLLLAGAGGCQSGAGNTNDTVMVVQVNSNLAVPSEMDEIDLWITIDGMMHVNPFKFPLGDGNALPLQENFLEKSGTAGTFGVKAGVGLGGPSFRCEEADVCEQAVANFVPGKAMVLKLFLAAECRGVTCPGANETCTTDGVCRSTTFGPDELTVFDANAPTGSPDAAAGTLADGAS